MNPCLFLVLIFLIPGAGKSVDTDIIKTALSFENADTQKEYFLFNSQQDTLITNNNGFSLYMRHTIHDFTGDLREITQIVIRYDSGEFLPRAAQLFVKVSDDKSCVDGFFTIQRNKKEIRAYFTLGALDIFAGLADIHFGYGFIPMGTFENIDLKRIIIPLDPAMISFKAQAGDTTWYNSR